MQCWSIQNKLAFNHVLPFNREQVSFTVLSRSSTPGFIFLEWLKCHSRACNASWLEVSPRVVKKTVNYPEEFSVDSEWEGGNQSGHFTQMSVNQGVCVCVCVCVCVFTYVVPTKQDVRIKVHFEVCFYWYMPTDKDAKVLETLPSKQFHWNYNHVDFLTANNHYQGMNSF